MATTRRYSEEEVRAILERALRKDVGGEGVAHDELVAVAAEIGVSREALEAAASELERGRGDEELRKRILAQRKAGFFAHLYAYLGVNAFLFLINVLTTPGIWWFAFPLLGWGLGLFFHVRAALSSEVSEHTLARERERSERSARRLERKREGERRQAERRARKERIEKGAAELGAAVEEGVGVLLSKVAEEIRKTSDRVAPSDEDRGATNVRVAPEDADLRSRDVASGDAASRDAASRDGAARDEAAAEEADDLLEAEARRNRRTRP